MDVVDALLAKLAPLAALVTPNLPEIARLVGRDVPAQREDMTRAGRELCAQGAKAVLVKGGHGDGDVMTDVLVTSSFETAFEAPRIATRNTHGTGCTLSSAIAAGLAHGKTLVDACEAAKRYLTGALEDADRLSVGRGHGPVNHFSALWWG